MILTGAHQIWSEGDLVCARWHGNLERDDVVAVCKLIEQANALHGHCFVLSDMAGMRSITKEARRYMANWARTHKPGIPACYGGSFALQTLTSLILRAIALLKGETTPIGFFKTESEARYWIDIQRRDSAARL